MLFSESFLRKLERLSIVSRQLMSGQLQGEKRSSKRGQSVEFADFRPYTPGDDFRHIDWNAYARLERFFLKLFVEEEDLTVHILVDVSRSMNWGQPNKLDYALRAAGALGYIALAGLDRVTVTLIGDKKIESFPPHRGKHSATALFDFLELYLPSNNSSPDNTVSPTSLSHAINSYAARSYKPGIVIIISDLFEPLTESSKTQPHLTAINTLASKGYEVSLLHILSPDEENPELSGDLKLLDSENRAVVEITADYDLLQRYYKGLYDWKYELRNFCGARGMNYIPIETSIPLDELLFAWMRQYSIIR